MTQKEPDREQMQQTKAKCQLILRIATGVILAAFLFIILLTTLSTGELVRAIGKILYYLIIFSIFLSLAVWGYSSRVEKKLVSDETNPREAR